MFERQGAGAASRLETAFVGRNAEMERILFAALDEVSTGQGRAIFVGGEPGIGKTSIGRRLAAHARTRGLHALWGRCREDDVTPPYWPWIELLRAGVLDLADEPLVAALLGPSPPGHPVPPSTPDTDRLIAFDGFTARLVEASAVRPLLLVFDDLQGADRSSLSLLQFVVQRIADAPVLILGLYRDIDVGRQHPLSHFLAEAAREPVVRRLSLRGLREDDVASFLEIGSGSRPTPALVDTVFRQTGGNPFFVKELVRLLLTDRDLAADAASGAHPLIPQSVREVIGRRLDGVSPECNRVLTLAAVIGREFAASVLERLAELPREALLGVLEEAARARLVVESAPGSGRHAFAHALIRDTLYAELPTTRRIVLHRRVGETLEALHASYLEPHLAELAFHFAEAARGGDATKAIAYALRAGHRAAASSAFEESVGCYESALETLDLAPERGEGMRCEVLLLLSEALWRSAGFERARATALEAFETARALGSVPHLARAALGVSGRMAAFGLGRCEQEVVDVLEEALRALGEDQPALRALVSARLAQEINLVAQPARLSELAGGAVEQARLIEDTATLASVLRNTYGTLWASRTADDHLRVAREIVALADRVGDRAMSLEGRLFAFLSHIELGDRTAAIAELEACTRSAERLRQRYLLWVVRTARACWASSEGPLDEFERLAQEALALGQEEENPAALLFFAAQLAYLMWLRGRFNEEEHAVLLQAGSFPLLMAPIRAGLAVTYALAGRMAEARSEFERFAVGEFAELRQDATWMLVVTQLADTCALLDDVTRAGALYARLLPHAGCNAVLVPVISVGSVDRHLGQLAATLRHWDDAERHFEVALSMNTRMHAWPQLAITQHDYARMLIARGRPEDRRRIASLLDEALASADRLGMAALSEKARTLMTAHTRDPSVSDGTERPPDASTPQSADAAACVFRKEGDFWTVAHQGTVARLKHRKGFDYLARLLRWPAREFAAFDMVTGDGDEPPPGRPHPARRAAPDARTLVDCGPVLDRAAREQYRRRHAELLAQLADAERMNDSLVASRLREEAEMLAEQLATAIGIGGRSRRIGQPAERSRSTVTKGIRGAIRAIQHVNPVLGRYLDTHVRTGYLCVYTPDHDRPILFRQ